MWGKPGGTKGEKRGAWGKPGGKGGNAGGHVGSMDEKQGDFGSQGGPLKNLSSYNHCRRISIYIYIYI